MTNKKTPNSPTKATPVTDSKMGNFYGGYASALKAGGSIGACGMAFKTNTDYATMYRDNWVAGRVIDTIPEDMTCNGVTLTGLSPEVEKAVQKALTKKQIWADLTDALKWARLHGGAIAVIEIVGQNNETELNVAATPKGSFSGLKVYDRTAITVSSEVITVGRDVGLPAAYKVCGQWVHHSRVIRFIGTALPASLAASQDYWGDSVLRRIWPSIEAHDNLLKAIGVLVETCRLRVHKIEGFHDAVRSNNAQWVLEEAALISQTQSITNTTVIDARDTMEALTYAFNGLPDLLVKYDEQTSGACGMPATRLYGQSPSGFNSGESDLIMYYDRILSLQERDLREGLERAVQIEVVSQGHTDMEFGMEFNPLAKPNGVEQSAIAKANTETVLLAYGAGLIDDVEAKQELMKQSTFGAFTTLTADSLDETARHMEISKALDQEATS